MLRRGTLMLGLLAIGSLAVSACTTAETPTLPAAPAPTESVAEAETSEDEHMDDEQMDDEHMEEEDMHSPDEHMEGEHDVPDEAAAVPNPYRGDEDSTSAGGELYATNCALCHGDTGEGDGPAASGLDVPPSDLHEDHVQALSDGALFYIISHGRPDTPMPAWENLLSEAERWHVVNFLRTFGED